MLQLSEKQTQAMADRQWQAFVLDTVAEVQFRAAHYLAGMEHEAACEKIAAGVRQAESLGLTTGRHVREYIAIQTVAGEHFAREPRFAGAVAVLDDRYFEPQTRLRRARAIVCEALQRIP